MGDLFHEHRLVGRCFWSTRGPELQVVELWCVVVVIVGVVEGLAALVSRRIPLCSVPGRWTWRSGRSSGSSDVGWGAGESE